MGLVAQVESEHDGETVGRKIVHGDRIGGTLSLPDSVDPIGDVYPVVGPVRLGVVIAVADDVPQAVGFVRIASLGAMVVENNVYSDRSCIIDDVG